MKVRFEHIEGNDRALTRVRNAMMQYAPDDMSFVIDDDHNFDVDLVIMWVFGRCGRTKRRIAKIQAHGVKYAIMQIALRTTCNPDVVDWMPVWEDAELIWSYYDLPQLAIDDGIEPTFIDRFYRSHLGVDSTVFRPTDADKKYLAVTVSRGSLGEGTQEVAKAALRVGGKVAHLGPPDSRITWVDNYQNISDEELADLYSSAYYVSGLRRTEGQDLPAGEGLLCGARPLIFNRPDQVDWYGEFSVILEDTQERQTIRDLADIFAGEYNPVTPQEIERARQVLSWRTFAEGFWSWL
jgi:hypothetical protein